MKLIFDTNIIHEDFHLYGPRITKLTNAAAKLGYDLMVPDVVVDEMVNQYRKKLIQFMPGYTGMQKLIRRTQGGEDKFDKDVFLSDNISEYETFLRKKLKGIGIKVIDYPRDCRKILRKFITN